MASLVRFKYECFPPLGCGKMTIYLDRKAEGEQCRKCGKPLRFAGLLTTAPPTETDRPWEPPES